MENNITSLEAVVTEKFTELVMKHKLTSINFKYFKKTLYVFKLIFNDNYFFIMIFVNNQFY